MTSKLLMILALIGLVSVQSGCVAALGGVAAVAADEAAEREGGNLF